MMKLTLPTSWVQGFISSNQSTLECCQLSKQDCRTGEADCETFGTLVEPSRLSVGGIE